MSTEPSCKNCGHSIAVKPRSSTGWTHVGDWQGVRCPGLLYGATPVAPDPRRFRRWLDAQLEADEVLTVRADTALLLHGQLGAPREPGGEVIGLDFVTEFGPGRARRDVDAFAEIVHLHRARRDPNWDREGHLGWSCAQCTTEYPCQTLRLIARVYSRRDGWQPDWRPE